MVYFRRGNRFPKMRNYLMKKSKILLALATSSLLLAACGSTPSQSSSSNSSFVDNFSTSSENEPNSSESESSSSHPSSESPSSSASSSSASSSHSSNSSTSDIDIPDPEPVGNVLFEGIGTTHWPVGHYFHALDGVTAKSQNGVDLTDCIQVKGFVDYGKKGEYVLTYSVNENQSSGSVTRTIIVDDSPFVYPQRIEREGEDRIVTLGQGSYRTGNVPSANGDNENLFKRAPNPVNLDAHLYNKGAVPSNQFFTGMMYGNNGGSTVLCMNPLDVSFGNGFQISCRGTGFTQYFDAPNTTGAKQTTMENFRPTFTDLTLAPVGLKGAPKVFVSDYSESSVELSLRTVENGEDEMVFKGSEASPYAFFESKTSNLQINLRTAGCTAPYEFYTVSGEKITGSSYKGEALVVRYPNVHYGYATTFPSSTVGAAQYQDLWYLVNVPKNSTFAFSQGSQLNAAFMAQVDLTLGEGNLVSIASINNMEEAPFYHQHGYSVPLSLHSEYQIAGKTVTTKFRSNRQNFTESKEAGLFSLFPHQWKKSEAVPSKYTKKTFRGTSKILPAHTFETKNDFYGVLPSFVLPDGIDKNALKGWMNTLLDDTKLSNNVSLDWKDSSKDFANAPGPYWNAKALYPLSQALIAADQIGEAALRDSLKGRLKTLLVDWFTYSGKDDVRYFFFDEKFGSLLYSTNNFSNNTRISDHHFTSGYLVFASAVLAMYDSVFLSQYGSMAKLVLQDYMNDGSNEKMPVLRGFDSYAGHSWADGIGDFGDGNDQESCGEALNSWTAGYLLAKALGDTSLSNAAAYGFATEMTSIKQYWFNYDEDNWIDSLANYTHVIGILWGGKNSCATWFGSNPEFIYGIHWLPTGEYLSHYVIGEKEKAVFQKIYSEMERKCGGAPRTWFSNMWAVEALVNPSAAMNQFDSVKIQNDDYKNELIGSYWMVHGLNTYGNKDVDAYFDPSTYCSATVYNNNGVRRAMVWNPSSSKETLTCHVNGQTKTIQAEAHSFTSCSL